MAEESKKAALQAAESGTDEEVVRHLEKMVTVDRRVVSRKETIGYMLFDGMSGFNINSQKELFIDSILQIGLDKQAIYNAIGGVWDIVDDLLIGGIVEKTRTRWGKFVPYIFIAGIPLAIASAFYWLLPNLFSAEHIADHDYLPKFIAFMLLEMVMEMLGNFKTVATSGYLSTITPYASDRRRLLAVTKYLNLFYSGLPNTIVEFLLDFITNGIIKSTAERTSAFMIKRALTILGPFTVIVSGLIATWYATVAKERVHQSVDTPKIKESLRIVFTNKPIMMYMISSALSSFGTGIGTNNYYRWVLFMTTFETICGIPSVAFQPIGYSKYNKLSEKYSTKSLFMASSSIPKAMYIPVYLYGVLLKDSNGEQFFKKRVPMMPITAIWEIIYATFSGVTSISSDEIRNECNDYIEWKCGHRSEATISVASTIICKIPNRINSILQPKFKKWIGYDQTAYAEMRAQPHKAQHWIFMMATLIPAILAIISVLPMIGYRIDKDTRDRMYVELNARRVAIAATIGDDESEEQ